MNTGEKIDYMIQCLKVVKAEYEYTADYIANEPTEQLELWKFLDTHRSPNKALIKDNLKNVARMGFIIPARTDFSGKNHKNHSKANKILHR